MRYGIVDNNGIITNIIICDDDIFAKSINAKILYGTEKIGDLYKESIPITKEDRLEAQIAYTAMMTDTLIGG